MLHTKSINVINRRGEKIPMNLTTISSRLKMLANMSPALTISTDYVATQTAAKLVDGIKTSEIDNISANVCASLISEDVEYDILATRIIVSDLHKNTYEDIKKYADDLTSYKYRSRIINILHPKVIAFIHKYHKELNSIIDYGKDYSYNFFGIVTMIKSYLLCHKYDNDLKLIKERPQQMLMRVSIGLNLNNISDDGKCTNVILKSIIDTYNLLSDKYYTHATPTLFNAGTINHTLSSCYLLAIDDSLDNIYKRLWDISKISKFSGGVGIHTSMVRAHNSVISSTIGRSEGLVPMLKVFNESTKYVSQGGGKRKGSTAVYVEPWHADIEACLLSQKNQGIPEMLCKDLFLALWVPDLFMKRLKIALKDNIDVKWSLMCPNECQGLADVYGSEFESLYESYEKKGMYRSQVSIVELWKLILSLQIETGKPYLMYKDHVNRKCNQNNLGTIKSSNLCVSEDTPILTNQGYKTIKYLKNTVVPVWNGYEFTPATIKKTNSNVDLLKLTFSDGSELKCTPYHKFSLLDGSVKEAKDLDSEIDKIMTCEMPIVLEGHKTLDLENPYFSATDYKSHDDMCYIPINSTYECRLQWAAGLVDVYGEVNVLITKCDNEDSIKYQYLHLYLWSKESCKKVKLLFNTLGCNPSITNEKHLEFTPYETMKLFLHTKLPTINIKLINRDDLLIDFEKPKSYISVVDILAIEGKHDTYCFNEPKKHHGVFNGVYSMNCSEITIYSDENNVGVCNLASICLPRFLKNTENGFVFDYELLNEVTQKIVLNMNKVIDNNKYPIKEAEFSDSQNRPIGIGTQGLAEVFMIMMEPFDSPKSREINKNIFETIYYAALYASNKLAKVDGPYKNFDTSLTSKGILQFDLWGVTPSSRMWDWMELKDQIKKHGLRNSLLLCQMPTAGTSIILGHTESVEVPQSNIYTRSTLSGRFQVINKHLIKELKKINLWNEKVKMDIMNNNGSIYEIEYIPKNIREVFKTVFEYKVSSFIEMCADREAFICQSSSNNRFISNPTIGTLTKIHLYSWKLGMKTSSYYTRTKAINTGSKINNYIRKSEEFSKIDNDEICESCSA